MKKAAIIFIILLSATVCNAESQDIEKLQQKARLYTERLEKIKAEYELTKIKLQLIRQEIKEIQEKAEEE